MPNPPPPSDKVKFGRGRSPLPPPERQCTATSKRTGRRCEQWAIAGGTVCRSHGGATPVVREAANRRLEERRARELMERGTERARRTLGLPVDVEPALALLQELHRTAGHVAWLEAYVTAMESDKLAYGVTKMVTLPDGTRRVEAAAAKSVWLSLYQEEREHLARVAKMALDAGVAERQVRLAEAQAEMMAGAIRGILSDLGVGNHPDAGRVVRKHLTSIAGTARELPSGNGSG